MKKILQTILISLFLIFMANQAWAANASTTATDKPLDDGSTVITISATGDDSSGAFTPILFDKSNNASIYRRALAKWLTSARTYPGTTAPTADYDIYIVEGASTTSEHVLTTPTLAIGSTTSKVSTVAFSFVINGVAYSKAAVTAGTTPGNDVIPQAKYGAVALDIGANGTIDVIEAADNATGYTSAALAIAGVAAAASDHVRLGYVTATKSDGAFTFGTTALNVANSTVTYTSTIPAFDIMGGRLVDRSATAIEEVYPANTAGDNSYKFIQDSFLVCIVNNSVASATITLELIIN